MMPEAPTNLNLANIIGYLVVSLITVLMFRLMNRTGSGEGSDFGRRHETPDHHSVVVPTPSGGTVTHELPGVNSDIIAALADVTKVLTSTIGEAKALQENVGELWDHLGEAHDNLDDVYQGVESGIYPPLPERRLRPNRT